MSDHREMGGLLKLCLNTQPDYVNNDSKIIYYIYLSINMCAFRVL